MKKKVICFLTVVISAAIAALTAYAYLRKGWAWLLCVTGCAAMVFVLAVVWALLGLLKPAKRGTSGKYRRKSAYLSRAEWEFLQVLRNILGAKYEVCVQAPLVSVIDKVEGGAFRNELFRVVDYLIADPVSFEPLLLIELNDASHNRADRAERDRKVAEICADARMPLIAFTIAESHDVPEVRKRVLKALK